MEQNKTRESLNKLHNQIGITYTAMAKGVGISFSFLQEWLKGYKNLSEENHTKAKRYLDDIKSQVANI